MIENNEQNVSQGARVLTRTARKHSDGPSLWRSSLSATVPVCHWQAWAGGTDSIAGPGAKSLARWLKRTEGRSCCCNGATRQWQTEYVAAVMICLYRRSVPLASCNWSRPLSWSAWLSMSHDNFATAANLTVIILNWFNYFWGKKNEWVIRIFVIIKIINLNINNENKLPINISNFFSLSFLIII